MLSRHIIRKLSSGILPHTEMYQRAVAQLEASTYAKKASELYKNNLYHDAIEQYNSAIKIHDNSRYRYGKALAHIAYADHNYSLTDIRHKHMLLALEELNKVLYLSEQVHASKAGIYMYLRYYHTAIEQYNYALQHNPGNISYIMHKAQCYCLVNQYSEALECYNILVALDKGNIDARIGIADCLYAIGDDEKAITAYITANKLMETHYANEQLARLFARMGNSTLYNHYAEKLVKRV